MGEERRVYCTNCEQTFVTTEVGTCPLCRKMGGLVDPMSPMALSDLVIKKRQEINPGQQLAQGLRKGADMVLLAWGVFWLTGSGILLISCGVALVFSPNLWPDPERWTFTYLVPGLGAIAVGVMLLFMACYWAWHSARAKAAARAGERGVPPVAKP